MSLLDAIDVKTIDNSEAMAAANAEAALSSEKHG